MKKNLIIGSIALILVIGAYSIYHYNTERLRKQEVKLLQKELVVAQAVVVTETARLSQFIEKADVQYRANTSVRDGYPRASGAVINAETALSIEPKAEIVAILALWKKEADLALLKGITPTAFAKIKADTEIIKEYLKKIAETKDLTPEQKKAVDDALKEIEDIIDDFPNEEDVPPPEVIEKQKEVVKEAEEKEDEIKKKIEEFVPPSNLPITLPSTPPIAPTPTATPPATNTPPTQPDENWHYDAKPDSDGPELIQGANPLYD